MGLISVEPLIRDRGFEIFPEKLMKLSASPGGFIITPKTLNYSLFASFLFELDALLFELQWMTTIIGVFFEY